MFTVIPLLMLVNVPGVQLFLFSNLSAVATDHTILRFANCYLTVFFAIQVPIVVGVWTFYFLKSKKQSGIPGSEVTIRAVIVFVVASLLTWIQAVKILQGFYTPTPETPVWFLQRPILYSGFFLPELLCVIIYARTNIRLGFLKPVREGVEKEHNNVGGVSDENRADTLGSDSQNKIELDLAEL